MFLTSNNTRELSEALKRRCLYLHVDYPDLDREKEIVLTKVPDISENLADQVARIVRSIRQLELKKAPSVSETLGLGAHARAARHRLDRCAASEGDVAHLAQVPDRHREGGKGALGRCGQELTAPSCDSGCWRCSSRVACLVSACLPPPGIRPDANGTWHPDYLPYQGVGTWVDAYDYVDGYQTTGKPAPLHTDVLVSMAQQGVKTVYLQVAKEDPRSPGDLIDPNLLGQWVTTAHSYGINVVGWYLPTLTNVDRDLQHLMAMFNFQVNGQTLDGIGVDIESRVVRRRERSQRPPRRPLARVCARRPALRCSPRSSCRPS